MRIALMALVLCLASGCAQVLRGASDVTRAGMSNGSQPRYKSKCWDCGGSGAMAGYGGSFACQTCGGSGWK